MDHSNNTLIVVMMAVVVLICLAGPAIAIFTLKWRKRRARQSRKSPFGTRLLRSAGHSLREKPDAAQTDVIFDVLLLSLLPTLTLSVFLMQGHLVGTASMVRVAPFFGLLVVAFTLYMLRKIHSAAHQMDRDKAGYDAEVFVGQELTELMHRRAAVFHDFPADGFNIDHIVVAREGVFAIETKGYTKSTQGRGRANATVTPDGNVLHFPGWSTQEPMEQADRQAQWLSKWLGCCVGEAVHVLPIVALPGWFVDPKGRGRVRVLSGKALHSLLNWKVAAVH